jgi:hypothetical protein
VNQVLFVSGGEAFRVSQPARGGYGELIVTPTLELLSELVQVHESRLSSHPLFVHRHRSADPTLQNLRARFLRCLRQGYRDTFAAEELLIDLLRCAFEPHTPRARPSGATSRLVERTKVLLEANACRSLRLTDVARSIGASPAYLTDVFRRLRAFPSTSTSSDCGWQRHLSNYRTPTTSRSSRWAWDFRVTVISLLCSGRPSTARHPRFASSRVTARSNMAVPTNNSVRRPGMSPSNFR